MTATVHCFAESRAQAGLLAEALGIACKSISVRQFPDGESLVRVEESADTALVYRSLDAPNAKLVEIMLAASALRANGARRVVLVAPYLAYMRQDRAFQPGEAVSQQVLGRIVTACFDGLVTVDPHLHRTPTLAAVVPGITAVNVSAAETISKAIAHYVTADTILVGPDSESRIWVESVAAPLGLEVIVGTKRRRGDRAVELALAEAGRAKGRPAILVDDLISSGGTLVACAERLREAGATTVSAVATHCLARKPDLALLAASGIKPILATDTVPGPVALIPIAPALAKAIREIGRE